MTPDIRHLVWVLREASNKTFMCAAADGAVNLKDKAHGLTTKSEEFAKQAEILAQQATIESKQGISCNCPSHFRYFSKRYAQEAAEAQAEAERHERLAQEYSAKKAAQENK